MAGSVCGTQLQLHTPDVVLKYLLLAVLPVVAFFTLRTKTWPEEPAPIPPRAAGGHRLGRRAAHRDV